MNTKYPGEDALGRSNQELNEAVAKKLGWTNIHHVNGLSIGNPNGAFIDRKNDKGEGQIPDYCHDISAAWEIMILKKICLIPTDKGWLASSKCVPLEENECEELWFPTNCLTRNNCQCGGCEIADTAPRVICLAFLKLQKA